MFRCFFTTCIEMEGCLTTFSPTEEWQRQLSKICSFLTVPVAPVYGVSSVLTIKFVNIILLRFAIHSAIFNDPSTVYVRDNVCWFRYFFNIIFKICIGQQSHINTILIFNDKIWQCDILILWWWQQNYINKLYRYLTWVIESVLFAMLVSRYAVNTYMFRCFFTTCIEMEGCLTTFSPTEEWQRQFFTTSQDYAIFGAGGAKSEINFWSLANAHFGDKFAVSFSTELTPYTGATGTVRKEQILDNCLCLKIAEWIAKRNKIILTNFIDILPE
jgi:hypothetical protein